MESLTLQERKKLYRICTASMLAEAFEHLEEEDAAGYFNEMDIKKASAVLEELDADTAANILHSRAFTISMATADRLVACDYVGIVSGNKVPDKFARAGFHATPSEFVNAPLIDELPMAVECELVSYDPDTCRLVGRIVNVSADESVLGENGKVDPRKLRPITFDPMNNTYVVLGETVGQAFKDGVKLR